MASGLSKQIRKINARMRTMAKARADVRPKEYDTIQATLKQLPTSQRKYNRKTKQYEFITPRRVQGETISILGQADKMGTQKQYLSNLKEMAKTVGADVSINALKNGLSASVSALIDAVGSEIFRLALDKQQEEGDVSLENMIKNIEFYQGKEYTAEEEERVISMNYLDF